MPLLLLDGRPQFGLSNSAQIPSSHAIKNYLGTISKVTECGSIRPFDQRLRYFGVIATILIVTVDCAGVLRTFKQSVCR